MTEMNIRDEEEIHAQKSMCAMRWIVMLLATPWLSKDGRKELQAQ